MVSQEVDPRSGTERLPACEHLFSRGLQAALLLACLALGGCGKSSAPKQIKLPPPINPRIGWSEVGVASWYGHPYHGRKTSNGETYDMNQMTAAHKRLPFGTWLRVENLSNGKRTFVRINDRGPFVGKRIIDLSRASAAEIQMMNPGTARVRLTVVRNPGRSWRKARNEPTATARRKGQFDIQVGVFAEFERANAMAKKVRKEGFAADIQPLASAERTLYKVLARGGSRSRADSRRKRLESKGIEAILTPRNGN